jgi:hypothetical protein
MIQPAMKQRITHRFKLRLQACDCAKLTQNPYAQIDTMAIKERVIFYLSGVSRILESANVGF